LFCSQSVSKCSMMKFVDQGDLLVNRLQKVCMTEVSLIRAGVVAELLRLSQCGAHWNERCQVYLITGLLKD
jgi:hypothetical protein